MDVVLNGRELKQTVMSSGAKQDLNSFTPRQGMNTHCLHIPLHPRLSLSQAERPDAASKPLARNVCNVSLEH